MREGLLWRDRRPGELADKIGEAAARFKEKYRTRPNCCHVHPSMIEADAGMVDPGKIVVVADARVLPGELWLGIAEEGECLDGLAQGSAVASFSSNGGG